MLGKYLDLEESNHRGAKCTPRYCRAIYVPCGGAEKGPFFSGASNMSISIMSISIIGILTTVQSCPVKQGVLIGKANIRMGENLRLRTCLDEGEIGDGLINWLVDRGHLRCGLWWRHAKSCPRSSRIGRGYSYRDTRGRELGSHRARVLGLEERGAGVAIK